MILFFTFILISITPLTLHAEETIWPSFRSSVVTNDGKPILRGGGPEPEEEEEKPVTDKSEITGEEVIARHDPSKAMVDDLTVLIDYLIKNYGYKIVQQTRRADDNDAEPLEEEFRSSKKKRKNKKNKSDKRKGSNHKNKHKSHKQKVERTENSNLDNDFNLSNENLSNDNNNNDIGDTHNQPSNNENFKFNADASNREHDDRNNFVNDFNGNMKSDNYEPTYNDGDGTMETSINLMDIVDIIRSKISSFVPQAEPQPPEEILRMPTDDVESPKNNFSLAFSVQI